MSLIQMIVAVRTREEIYKNTRSSKKSNACLDLLVFINVVFINHAEWWAFVFIYILDRYNLHLHSDFRLNPYSLLHEFLFCFLVSKQMTITCILDAF